MQLSEKRKVTMQEFRGKPLVSIREYFKKGGKEFPTSKGKFLLVAIRLLLLHILEIASFILVSTLPFFHKHCKVNSYIA